MTARKPPAPRPALRPVGDRWVAAVPVASPVGAAWPRAADLVSSGPVPVDPGPGTIGGGAAGRAADPVATEVAVAKSGKPQQPPSDQAIAEPERPKKAKKPKSGKKARKAAADPKPPKAEKPARAGKAKAAKPAKSGKPEKGKAAKDRQLRAGSPTVADGTKKKQRASAPLTGLSTAPDGPHPDRPLTVMLTPEQARRLQRQAREAGRAETHLVAELLDVWLEPRQD